MTNADMRRIAATACCGVNSREFRNCRGVRSDRTTRFQISKRCPVITGPGIASCRDYECRRAARRYNARSTVSH
ncbi:MAG TPA: hypothetical protein VFE41_31685 [Acetobacteraceae bacterium]|jgi:hypothetical protein|nr:hypothetical protein [Acetobacteraceae bacterium]